MKIILLLFSYLFGAIPSGYIAFRISERRDIRKHGSGSTGATNLLRLKGLKWTIPVALFDIFKGVFPVYLSLKIFDDQNLALLCAFLAVFGHCFPIYLKFKGGKGVATALGAYIVLFFKPILPAFAVFVIVIVLTRYVSLGSLSAAFSYLLFALFFSGDKNLVILTIVIFFLIAIRHHGNIKRLINGEEKKLGRKVEIS
jgi:glycerol-3-phosphate acyltransferase PlsY